MDKHPEFLHIRPEMAPQPDTWKPRIERAVAFLSENLATPVSRSRLATVAGLSESRLHDVFKEVMGEAPMAYLNRRRIQQAAFLLARSSQPVADIGDACGFPSPQYFSRFFHNKTGLSPSAFRRQFQ